MAAAIKKISKNIKWRKHAIEGGGGGVGVSFFEAQQQKSWQEGNVQEDLNWNYIIHEIVMQKMLVFNGQKIKLHTYSLSYKTHNPKGVAGTQCR